MQGKADEKQYSSIYSGVFNMVNPWAAVTYERSSILAAVKLLVALD